MINWENVKFRASSWGNLMTEPKTKEDKLAGKLSVTCQKELIKIYNLVKYGRKKEIVTKQMTKGVVCESDGIALVSRLDKRLYVKNEQQLENSWATGHPDLFSGDDIMKTESIDDIKISFELDTFTPKIIEPNDNGYDYQLNVYFDLVGEQCRSGSIIYCLVSAPEFLIMEEKRKLLYRMDIISEESPEFKEAAAEIDNNMIFEDIPIQERVIKHTVKRDNELIQRMKDKVPVLRQWLSDFEKKHLSFYPK